MEAPSHDPRLEALRSTLRHRGPVRIDPRPGLRRAAVALVVRAQPATLELLFIKRAPRVGDPWSGHIALPGGKLDPFDPDLRHTAMRETLEEVGINLKTIGFELGPLDEVQPLGAGAPAVAVAPYAFAVPGATPTVPNREVDEAFWVPLEELADPALRAAYAHEIGGGRSLRFPSLRYRGHTIWGLTYRIVSQFVDLTARVGRARRE
jgi:8-oxo-dGTP pyrophosphatase MutT (NUDIX family)